MATLEVSRRLHLFDVRGGRVAAVWRDDLGVEHVRLYALLEGS